MIAGTYDAVRDQIQDGDIVFVGHGTSVFSRLTEFVTRSPFFHVAIAFWMRDAEYESRLMLVEAHQGGRRIVTASAYQVYPMKIVQSDVPFTAYSRDLLDRAGSVPYGYLDYVAIGMRELFGVKMDNFKGEVCSEMVAASLNKGGHYLPTLISPAKLYDRLVSDMGWQIRADVMPNKP